MDPRSRDKQRRLTMWRERALFRYGAAALLVLLGLLLWEVLPADFQMRYVYITFYPVVALITLFFGLYPTLFALVLTAVAVALFVLHPRGSFLVAHEADILALVMFVGASAFIGMVGEAYRRTRGEAVALAERLGLFIDHAPVALAMFDRGMRYLHASRRWRLDYGLGDRPLQGISHYEVFPEIGEKWKQVHARALAGEIVRNDGERFVRQDGSVQWVRWEVRPWRDAAGEIGGIVIFAEEITERMRAEENLRRAAEALRASEERFRALVTATSDVTYRMNADWTEVRGPQGGDLATGAGEPATSWLQKYIPPDDLPQVSAAIAEAIRDKRVFTLEHRVLRPDGSLGWTYSRAVPIKDEHGEIVEWFGSSCDVTARRQAELALEEANARLREADRRKNEFLSMLSHELRNPLAPIRNSLYILDRAAPGGPEARRAQAVIDRQVGHLTRLIDDLLDITRITRGKIRLRHEPLDLQELAKQAVDDYRALFAERGVELAIEAAPAPIPVQGDRTRLVQVIGNLLQNAAKFTPQGGRATLAAGMDAARGEAIITVQDTGSGIPPEILPHLFEPFVQADSTLDRSKGGLGLGLALVKELVEMHGGTASASSEGPGRGATFTIRLPLDAAVIAAARMPRPARADLAPRRVLVIEDNPDSADSLREALEMEGHQVELADTGPEGIEKARRFAPDVVICDIGLPGMNGYDVARTMRADPALREATLLALTGYTAPEDVARALAAGFDMHFAKPLDMALMSPVLHAPAKPPRTPHP